MIGVYNIKSDLKQNLSKVFQLCDLLKVHNDFPKIDGLFVDWLPSTDNLFSHQAVIIDTYVKQGIPTIIFDRYFNLTYEHYNWLSKFSVTFLEPAICNRSGFEYFPFWTKPLDEKWYSYIKEDERPYDLIYQGELEDRVASFEKYFLGYMKIYPKTKSLTSSKWRSLTKRLDEFRQYGEFTDESIKWQNGYFTILIGSKFDYKTGYLREDLFDILKQGCLTLLPEEHRFFSGAFQRVRVEDESYLNYFFVSHKDIRPVVIEELYSKILETFPEMDINVATERIRSIFTI